MKWRTLPFGQWRDGGWKQMLRLAIAIAAVLWMIALPFMAGAATLRGNKESCMQLGNVVLQAGDVRDSGVSWEVFKTRLDETLAEAKANPASFVQSDEDTKFILKALHLLWKNPEEVPFIVATAVYRSCMELPT